MALDLDGVAREAEAWLRKLDDLRQEVEAMERELRRTLERQAQDFVQGAVPPERQEAARLLVARSVRIWEEVGAWAVGRSPVGLVQRLLPELRAGAGEVVAFLEGAPARRAGSSTAPTPARLAP